MIWTSKRNHLVNSCMLRVQALWEAGTLDPIKPDNEARKMLGASDCV